MCSSLKSNVKVFLMLLFFVGLGQATVKAQVTSNPACNVTGPLIYCANMDTLSPYALTIHSDLTRRVQGSCLTTTVTWRAVAILPPVPGFLTRILT